MAKRTSAPRRKAPARKSAAGKSPSLWIILLCLLPVIVLVWFLMHLEAGRDEVRRADAVRQRKPAAETPQKPTQPRYDFYKELPKGSVILPPAAPPEKKTAEKKLPEPTKPEQLKPAPPKSEIARANTALRGEVPAPRPPPPRQSQQQYFLQAGSFRSAADAEQLRARLALLGQVTRLEQGKVSGQIWYRVMIGPFVNQEQMGKAKVQLAAQGFKQLLPQKR